MQALLLSRSKPCPVGKQRALADSCYLILIGLIVYPSLIPAEVQRRLLDQLLHRDLANPTHKTNLHLHYYVPYPMSTAGFEVGANSSDTSFFLTEQQDRLEPKNPALHKPITIKQMLEKKLRWVTLGGQYDWTAKMYPNEVPPAFPQDISTLLRGLFPTVDAQAAIVNFYSPGDTLSMHRDVSEECDRDLISISIGCDGLFVIGNETGTELATIRLRSGDAVLMGADSRFAWHGVPKILSDTCPKRLGDWPASEEQSEFDGWAGWMQNKRINLNVRQMRSQPHQYADLEVDNRRSSPRMYEPERAGDKT